MGLWSDTGEHWVESRRDRLIALIKRDAVKYGTYTLASGQVSTYYIDGRKCSLSAEAADIIGRIVLGLVPSKVVAIGGPSIGADPIVGATLAAAGVYSVPLYGFLVRNASKLYGTKAVIEGHLPVGKPVVIVDDVITTGGSVWEAIKTVRGAGAIVVKVISIVDRLQGAAESFKSAGIDYHAVLTVADLGLAI